jgi:hypothetical protein
LEKICHGQDYGRVVEACQAGAVGSEILHRKI